MTANAVHPGGVSTALFSKGGGLLSLAASLYMKAAGRSPKHGADGVLWLAASREVEGKSDSFWADRAERRCRFRDAAQEERLYALCERMTASGS